MRTCTSVVMMLLLAACGIPDGTLLAELDAADATEVCSEYEPRTITCTEGDATWTREFATDCAGAGVDVPAGCPATVGDYRACEDAYRDMTDEQICADDLPAACGALFVEACVFVDTD